MSLLNDPPLDFPRKVIKKNGRGRPILEEYEIPEQAKEAVLKEMYPFEGVPSLSETRYDLHEGKNFLVGDFKVIREQDVNYLVSPYYYSSGGTAIDWMPARSEQD